MPSPWKRAHRTAGCALTALYFALLGFCEFYGGFNKLPANSIRFS